MTRTSGRRCRLSVLSWPQAKRRQIRRLLYDPSATLGFDASELARYGAEAIPRASRSAGTLVSTIKLLRSALGELIELNLPTDPRDRD